MQQVLYMLIAAVVIGIYFRDSGLWVMQDKTTKTATVTSETSHNSIPLQKNEVSVSEPVDLQPVEILNPVKLSNLDNHSIRIMYCTS
jgi:hypothetical protein